MLSFTHTKNIYYSNEKNYHFVKLFLLKKKKLMQNIYSVYNNFEKSLYAYRVKYKRKCFVNHAVNNALVIYLIHDRLDLDIVWYTINFVV